MKQKPRNTRRLAVRTNGKTLAVRPDRCEIREHAHDDEYGVVVKRGQAAVVMRVELPALTLPGEQARPSGPTAGKLARRRVFLQPLSLHIARPVIA